MTAAGTDPAYVPGLTFARPAEPARESPERAPQEAPEDAASQDGTAGTAPVAGKAAGQAAGEEDSEPGPDAAPEFGEDGAEPDFEVSDARGSIAAGRAGIRFRLDEETAEFGWGEIGAVEITTPRLGRRFTVTVHTTGRRTYEADIEAPSRSLPRQWAAEFEAVLDDYFEDDSSAGAAEGAAKA